MFNIKEQERLQDLADRQYDTFQELKSYIINRYNNFKDIGSFHVEYSHKEDRTIFQICGMNIDKYNYLEEINNILEDGIYYIFQLEGAVCEGELYELMSDLIDLRNDWIDIK